MKIGDKIVCKKACVMIANGLKTTTVGKTYVIEALELGQLVIRDDEDDIHYFNITKGEGYYGNYFSTLKMIRKDKIKKIVSI